MGYSTEFEGSIKIEPPVKEAVVKKINDFCEERHGTGVSEFPGMPSFWCDYAVSEDGSTLSWNGAEKSYHMDEWLKKLIKMFFAPVGSVLNGELHAQGEDPDDRWILVVKDNVVSTKRAKVVWMGEDDE